MPFVQAGPLRIHYQRAGDGPRLLYVGGSGGDLRSRPGVFESPLASSFDLLAYDQRGLGQTGKPAGPYTMAQYADDAAALLDAIGWSTARVMGVSFGGMVAQELALRHPDRVERLVLACTSAGGGGGVSYPLHELASLPAEEAFRRQLPIRDVRHTPQWQADHPEAVARMWRFAQAAAELGRDDPDKARGFSLQLRARAGHDTWSRLDGLRVPTLLCAGRYDGQAPLSNMQALASRIADSTLRIYEGGHLFLAQDPGAFRDIVNWLRD